MNNEKKSHKTQIVVAVIGLVSTLAAAFIANWEKVFPPQANHLKKEQSIKEPRTFPDDSFPAPPIIPAPTQYFMGTYVGTSTEGINQYQIQISLNRIGNNVTGTYSQAGLIGSIRGTINGNTLYYRWNIEGETGSGISIATGDRFSGTWGYGNSYDDGGQVNATLQ